MREKKGRRLVQAYACMLQAASAGGHFKTGIHSRCQCQFQVRRGKKGALCPIKWNVLANSLVDCGTPASCAWTLASLLGSGRRGCSRDCCSDISGSSSSHWQGKRLGWQLRQLCNLGNRLCRRDAGLPLGRRRGLQAVGSAVVRASAVRGCCCGRCRGESLQVSKEGK